MKYSKSQTHSNTYKIPALKFEDQRLTSFSGLVIYQALFRRLQFKACLHKCFRHLNTGSIFGHTAIMLLLVIHLLLGYRRLRDMKYYQDDPMVKRLLGLHRIPNVSTVSRALEDADDKSYQKIRSYCRDLCSNRLREAAFNRVTMDFDGSVISTGRYAEGSAVGFNKQKKGRRSYYPLFCTIAQTGQVFDVLHRSGNVHDSNGAKAFILDCIREMKQTLPYASIEVRMDSAFFSEEIVEALEKRGIEFTISVPFERYAEMKGIVESRKRWRGLWDKWSYFEIPWKPKKWTDKFRFVFIRQRVKIQNREPVQLDLFIPHAHGFDFKVIVTNKRISAKKVLTFHNGRGSQEGIFAELKSHGQGDYVPVRGRVGNQLYLMAAVIAHNLTREMQMQSHFKSRGTTEKRAAFWEFHTLGTIRRKLIQRAGRLTFPKRKMTLTMGCNESVKRELLHYMEQLSLAA